MLPYHTWLVWLLPIVGSIFVPLAFKVNRKVGELYPFVVALASAILSILLIPEVWGGKYIHSTIRWIPIAQDSWIEAGTLADPLSVLFATIATFLGSLILLYSIGYMGHESGLERYYFFMLFFIGAMAGLVLSDNLLQMYIFWEIVGLCSYALIGFWYRKPSAAHASIKAFVTTRVGDVALLIGILLLYVNLGTFSLKELSHGLHSMLSSRDPASINFVIMTMLLVFGGAVGKSAQFPLHVWLPDAMEGPTPVSALIHAATMVKAGVFLVARMVYTVIPLETFTLEVMGSWYGVVAIIGASTAFLAATMGLVMTDIKRVIAYSTISQLGLMFAALGLSTELGWVSSQFHVLSHSIFKALLFLSAGAVIHAVHSNDIDQMGGLRRYMPITFVTALIGALALSGVPPFSGFFSKDLIIEACIQSGSIHILILVILTSILTIVYILRWIYKIFFGKEYSSNDHIHEAPKVMTVPLILLAAMSLVIGFFEEQFMEYMGIKHHFSVSLSTYIVSFIILSIGVSLAYIFYFSCSIRGMPIVNPSILRIGKFSSFIHRMLINRYYIDALYYKVFVDGLLWLSSIVRRYIEEKVIDGFNYAIAKATEIFVQAFRNLQTGISNVNISGYAIGIALFILMLLLILMGVL